MRRFARFSTICISIVENTHGGLLFTKSNILPWVFSRFLNCTNGTKLRKAPHIDNFQHNFNFHHSYSVLIQ